MYFSIPRSILLVAGCSWVALIPSVWAGGEDDANKPPAHHKGLLKKPVSHPKVSKRVVATGTPPLDKREICSGGSCSSCFGSGYRSCPGSSIYCYDPDILGSILTCADEVDFGLDDSESCFGKSCLSCFGPGNIACPTGSYYDCYEPDEGSADEKCSRDGVGGSAVGFPSSSSSSSSYSYSYSHSYSYSASSSSPPYSSSQTATTTTTSDANSAGPEAADPTEDKGRMPADDDDDNDDNPISAPTNGITVEQVGNTATTPTLPTQSPLLGLCVAILASLLMLVGVAELF